MRGLLKNRTLSAVEKVLLGATTDCWTATTALWAVLRGCGLGWVDLEVPSSYGENPERRRGPVTRPFNVALRVSNGSAKWQALRTSNAQKAGGGGPRRLARSIGSVAAAPAHELEARNLSKNPPRGLLHLRRTYLTAVRKL